MNTMKNTISLASIALSLLALTSCQTSGYPGPDVKTAARVTVFFKS